MSTVMEIGYDNVEPSAPATRTISTKLPSHNNGSWRQHLVTPGYSCLRNLRQVDEKWGYDYNGDSKVNPNYGKPFLLISTAAASVVATATSGPRCPDGNLVVIAKPGPDKAFSRIRQPTPDATLARLIRPTTLSNVGRIRRLRRIRHKNRLSYLKGAKAPLIIGFSALLPGSAELQILR